MKFSNKLIALGQSAGLIIYIYFFALLVQYVQLQRPIILLNPVAGITLFLVAFVISALISASLLLGYPLFFEGRKKEALNIVFYSCLWLVVFLIVFAVFSFL